MDHLVQALEVALQYWALDMTGVKLSLDDFLGRPDLDATRTVPMRKAIYRILIVGASLAGAYSEPLFRAQEEGIDTDWPKILTASIENKQLDFLEKFALYNINSSVKENETVFSSVAEWLLQSILMDTKGRTAMAQRFDEGVGRALACQNRRDCPVRLTGSGTGGDDAPDSDSHFVVWQVMQMIWVALHIEQSVFRPFKSEAFGPDNPAYVGQNVIRGPLEQDEGHYRRMPAVFYGVFEVEMVTVPKLIARRQEPMIMADSMGTAAQAGDSTQRTVSYIQDSLSEELPVRFLLAKLFRLSKKPNHVRMGNTAHGNPVAPLTSKFFEYFLQHFLGVRYSHAWEDAPGNGIQFLAGLSLFTDDDPKYFHLGPGESIYDAYFLDGSEFLSGVDTSQRFYQPIP